MQLSQSVNWVIHQAHLVNIAVMSRPLKRQRTASDPEVQQVQNLEEFRVPEMPNAEVFYVAHFIGEDTANEWYNELLKLDSCTLRCSLSAIAKLWIQVNFRVPT